MKIIFGSGASQAFEILLKDIKDQPTYFCAVSLRWNDSAAAPWLKDSQRLKIMSGLVDQAMGKESSKATFLCLPTGSIFIVLDHAGHEAYLNTQTCVQNIVAEVGSSTLAQAFDLSVDWNSFVAACKEEYQRIKQLSLLDHTETLRKLDNQLAQAADNFAARPQTKTNLRLLFVEDDASTRHLLNGLLGDKDYSVRFAENGESAIREYCNRPPHLVFLDINLPDISGLELLQLIRRHDKAAYPVMLTSSADMSGVAFAKEHGVKGYIVKPFSLQKLEDCLARYISL